MAKNIMIQGTMSNVGKSILCAALCRIFRQATGITVARYLVSYRLAEAKKLLVDTDLQIAVIAANCGFDSSSHFCIVFRQYEGITPKEFRRNTRSDRITE